MRRFFGWVRRLFGKRQSAPQAESLWIDGRGFVVDRTSPYKVWFEAGNIRMWEHILVDDDDLPFFGGMEGLVPLTANMIDGTVYTGMVTVSLEEL